jgi:glyoxylase-like metal-dependent hydrolase (beta-lactamase superfamily II)
LGIIFGPVSIINIVHDVIFIFKLFKLNRHRIYIYLIYGRKITLIDSGVASSAQIIMEYLNETGKSSKDISLLILTHAHPDHIGAAKALKSMSGCAVAAHAAERTWIEDVDLQARERPVPGFKSLVEGSVPVDLVLQGGKSWIWATA